MIDAQLEALVGLLGIDHDPGFNAEVSAFQQGFSREKCVVSWRKVGAAMDQGVAHACISNKQVM